MTTTQTGLTLPDADRYARGHDQIPGWFEWLDARLFDAMLSIELGADIHGDLLEIGCYRGKSAILLGYGRRSTESLVVCDPFENVMSHPDVRKLPGDADPAGDYLSDLRADQFLQYWDQFHYWRPDIRACESSELDLGDQRMRFTHVDGCHNYQCVAKDIELAVEHTAPLGIVVIDDYRNAAVPGVAAAAWEAAAKGVIHPFCVSAEKMYTCTKRQDRNYWVEMMRNVAVPLPWQSDVYSFPTYDVIRCFDIEHGGAQ